jgi:hypothetical protein
MLTLDDDETDLALMALRIAAAMFFSESSSGCSKAVDDFCLPRLRGLIDRIEQHQKDEAEEKADA